MMEQLVEEIRQRYFDVFSTHLESADGTPFYAADLVMLGILDRQIGLLESMPNIFETRNIHALAPLLRIQLDSLLRLHAFRIVENIDELTGHMLEGGELYKFKDREGNQLRDRYLVNSLKKELPWVETMYTTLSGWVHLSENHIFSPLSEGKEERSIRIGIGSFRETIPDELFEEATEAIKAIHENTAVFIEAYFARSKA